MRYLLDTNICVYISKRRPAQVMERFDHVRPGEMGMWVITYFELMFGAWKSHQREFSLGVIEALRRWIAVLPLEEGAASEYGRVRAQLERAGIPIGNMDLLIASHALSLGLTLVTNNVREFSRIEGLKIENWAA